MDEFYILNGALLIICGLVLLSHQTYQFFAVKNVKLWMISEALGFIAIGGFYIYCSFRMKEAERNLENCDFTTYFLENAGFVCSLIHTLMANLTEIMINGTSKTMSKKLAVFTCQWLIPLFWVCLLFVCNDVNYSPSDNFNSTNVTSDSVEVSNTINAVYKIIFESANYTDASSFLKDRVRTPKEMPDCWLEHENHMKVYLFALLIFGYFIPLIMSVVFANLSLAKNQWYSMSLMVAALFWSPAFLEMCFRNFVADGKNVLSDVLSKIANLYYVFRTRNLVGGLRVTGIQQVQPLESTE